MAYSKEKFLPPKLRYEYDGSMQASDDESVASCVLLRYLCGENPKYIVMEADKHDIKHFYEALSDKTSDMRVLHCLTMARSAMLGFGVSFCNDTADRYFEIRDWNTKPDGSYYFSTDRFIKESDEAIHELNKCGVYFNIRDLKDDPNLVEKVWADLNKKIRETADRINPLDIPEQNQKDLLSFVTIPENMTLEDTRQKMRNALGFSEYDVSVNRHEIGPYPIGKPSTGDSAYHPAFVNYVNYDHLHDMTWDSLAKTRDVTMFENAAINCGHHFERGVTAELNRSASKAFEKIDDFIERVVPYTSEYEKIDWAEAARLDIDDYSDLSRLPKLSEDAMKEKQEGLSVYIDGENMSPLRTMAFLRMMEDKGVVFDSIRIYVSTNEAGLWNYTNAIISPPDNTLYTVNDGSGPKNVQGFEIVQTNRVIGNKSIVDFAMQKDLYIDHFVRHVPNMMVLSSDSDFAVALEQMVKATTFTDASEKDNFGVTKIPGSSISVVVETYGNHTSQAYLDRLKDLGIECCRIDGCNYSKFSDIEYVQSHVLASTYIEKLYASALKKPSGYLFDSPTAAQEACNVAQIPSCDRKNVSQQLEWIQDTLFRNNCDSYLDTKSPAYILQTLKGMQPGHYDKWDMQVLQNTSVLESTYPSQVRNNKEAFSVD